KAYNLLNDESVLIKSTKGYTVQVGEKRKANDFLKEEMKNKLEALLVDAFIHQRPEEEIAAWSEVIMKELKKGVETNEDIHHNDNSNITHNRNLYWSHAFIQQTINTIWSEHSS